MLNKGRTRGYIVEHYLLQHIGDSCRYLRTHFLHDIQKIQSLYPAIFTGKRLHFPAISMSGAKSFIPELMKIFFYRKT